MTLSSTARQIIFWLLIVAGALLLYKLVNPTGKNATAIDLTTLYAKIDAGEVRHITVKQNETVAIDSRNQEYRAQLTNDQMKNELFKKANEQVNGKPRVDKFEDESGTSSYIFGVGIEIPVSNRNQGERAKALIEKKKAQNQQQLLTNQVRSDVDKALVAFEKQKHRVDLYRTGVITKVNDIQNKTQIALQAGESSTLELLDAIRTRRDTLAGFYQTLFDYQMSLLDLELATATPLHH